MVRYAIFLILISCATPCLHAQEPPPRPPGPPPHRGEPGKLPPKWREHLKEMSEEDRERFQKNLKKWESMNDEERQALRERMRSHRQAARAEFEDFLKETGVTAEDERKAIAKRYFEERRKIEMRLREEMDERRKTLVDEMEAKLAKELKSGDE